MKNIAGILMSLVILLAAIVLTAQATSYNFITLDVDPAVGYETQGRGINNNADVAGRYRDYSNAAYSFLYAGGSYTPFHDPDHDQTIAYGINDSQQMVGLEIKTGTTSHGFLLSGGVYTPLQVGSFYTQAYGINNSSQIVGIYINSGTTIGFLNVGGSYSDISYGGASETIPRDINESGLITGYYKFSGLYHGFLYQNGGFINSNFMVPGSTQTQPTSINNLGQVVGT